MQICNLRRKGEGWSWSGGNGKSGKFRAMGNGKWEIHLSDFIRA
jgi:hypothetical protein